MGSELADTVIETILLQWIFAKRLESDEFLLGCLKLQSIVPQNFVDMGHFSVLGNFELQDLMVFVVLHFYG